TPSPTPKGGSNPEPIPARRPRSRTSTARKHRRSAREATATTRTPTAIRLPRRTPSDTTWVFRNGAITGGPTILRRRRFHRPACVREGTDMSSETLKASMSCEIDARPGALRLAYRIRNDGETRLGLFNRIATLRADGTQDFAPANAYIDLDGRTLRVRKQVLPVPPDLKMAGRQLPGLTVLDPGKVFQEGWSVETPVRVCEPMQRALLALRSKGGSVVADRPAEADSVELAIGVVEIDSGWRLDPVSAAHPDIFQVWPPGQAAAGQQNLLQPQELSPPLPLLHHRLL